MERKLKRQQRTVGSIVKIPLENGYHTYGRILKAGLAFYDAHTKKELSPKEIIKKKVLFRTGVYDSVITKGYWHKVGKAIPLDEKLKKSQDWYTEDLLTNRIIIHRNGEKIVSSREAVRDIECLAVWDYAALEGRLNIHYASRKNQEIEMM